MDDASLNPPYGGTLVDLLSPPAERREWKERANALPSWQLGMRALCDLELLATGAFSPLAGFMSEADYRRVLAEMRLADGTFFPMPLTLPVPAEASVRPGQDVVLRDARNEPVAVLASLEL